MQQNFPYEPGYVGELNEFSALIAADLERLVKQLNPSLAHPITKEGVAYFQNAERFRQIIAVEELEGRPTIVGTANLSVMQQSYDKDFQLTDMPMFWLGGFVVDENVRGKGIARRLWDKIAEVATEENIHLLQFTSRPSREAAHKFYAKMGATPLVPVLGKRYEVEIPEVSNGAIPRFEQNFELATGLVAIVFSASHAKSITEQEAQNIAARCGTVHIEQITPVVDSSNEATTVLFSTSF